MTDRHIGAKLPDGLFRQLKAALARHDLTVREWVTRKAEELIREDAPPVATKEDP